jgi:hypothetical protein
MNVIGNFKNDDEEGGDAAKGEEASPALNVNNINPGGEVNINKGEKEDNASNSLDTYTYRDFAAIPAPQVSALDGSYPPTLQAQKLPAKLASMLTDPGKR